jgi:1-aminocyclopropane-1-carboxylate deaminase/D-cysteine desulfhydrase-like pyridoxal-dependent ACC family enzyme
MGTTTGPTADLIERELTASLPTPLSRLRALESKIGQLWCKNDGLTGTTYGGNKLRKLAPLLRRAKERGIRRLVTIGAAGSHHVLATTIYAHAAGLEAVALYVPQVHTPHAERTFRAAIGLGVCPLALGSRQGIAAAARAMRRDDEMWIGPGAIGPTGSAAYAEAVAELWSQVDESSIPERIVVAVGSGSTAAGLLVGLLEHRSRGPSTTIAGVLTAPNPAARSMILAQAVVLGRRRGLGLLQPEYGRRLEIINDQHGGAYGRPTAAGQAATERAASVGLDLDPTYTAKAFAAALRLTDERPGPTLYWHTLSARPLAPLLADAPTLDQLPERLRRLLVPNPNLDSHHPPQAR